MLVGIFLFLLPERLEGGVNDGDDRVSPEELSLLCQFDKRSHAISIEADARIGQWSSKALKKGQIIPIEGEITLLPKVLSNDYSYINDYYSDKYNLENHIKKVKIGNMNIVNVIIYNEYLNYYFVFIENLGVHGFVRSDALVWYDRNRERASDHAVRRSKWADIRIVALRTEIFEDAGMDYYELFEKALTQGVYQECEKWK